MRTKNLYVKMLMKLTLGLKLIFTSEPGHLKQIFEFKLSEKIAQAGSNLIKL